MTFFLTDGPVFIVFLEVALGLFWSISLVINSSGLVILGLKYLMIAAASRASSVDHTWGFVPGSYQGSHSASCFGNALRALP